MSRFTPMALWQHPPTDLIDRLERVLDAAAADGAGPVFFRDDDAGPPCPAFYRLVRIFQQHRAPLGLAVVPLWLPMRFGEFINRFDWQNPQWCLHQHGFSHTNHQPDGEKKQEFGPARGRQTKMHDLARGRLLLERFLGKAFTPIFTPPWNRCDTETLELLKELEFRGVSRSDGAKPPAPAGLPDAQVNVDLHTLKGEPTPETAHAQAKKMLAQLAESLRASAAGGPPCGIMLHHDRMNPAALDFSSALLAGLAKRKIPMVSMAEVLPTRG